MKKGLSISIALLMLLGSMLTALSYGSIIIDGYFDDWDDKPHSEIWNGRYDPEDAYSVSLFADGENLYIHVVNSEDTGDEDFDGFVSQLKFNNRNNQKYTLQVEPDDNKYNVKTVTNNEAEQNNSEAITNNEAKQNNGEAVANNEARQNNGEAVANNEAGQNNGEAVTNNEAGQNNDEAVANNEAGQKNNEGVTNNEAGQNNGEVVANNEAGQNNGEAVTNNEAGQNKGDAVTNNEAGQNNGDAVTNSEVGQNNGEAVTDNEAGQNNGEAVTNNEAGQNNGEAVTNNDVGQNNDEAVANSESDNNSVRVIFNDDDGFGKVSIWYKNSIVGYGMFVNGGDNGIDRTQVEYCIPLKNLTNNPDSIKEISLKIPPYGKQEIIHSGISTGPIMIISIGFIIAIIGYFVLKKSGDRSLSSK